MTPVSKRNLLEKPYWKSEDLGKAIPQSPHAVSVALPRWEDVIAYEEKDPGVLKSLEAIYPRFGLNPLVQKVAQLACDISEWEECSAWPYPTFASATKARNHCSKNSENGKTNIKKVLGLYCLIADTKSTPKAKEFWQHTGIGASSRLAAIALNQEAAPAPKAGEEAREILRKRLAEIYSCPPKNVELFPSGMAALESGLEAITQLFPNKSVLQLGFPYVDVLKLPQRVFQGSDLLLKTDLEVISAELDRRKPAAVVVELPSNPLLQCIDLQTVSQLVHQRDIPLIADDTIGSALNLDALPFADLIFSSLTKSFAGRGDILAGSLVISPMSRWAQALKTLIGNTDLTPLADSDAIALEEASRDIKDRIPQLNKACLTLKRHLESHPAVEQVFHPESCPNFQSLMRKGGGHGCLLSFQVVGGLSKAKKFYNSLATCKGPSLGTNFTLVCPYVLLAHYNELDWAQKCGVSPHLLRVSVGLEEPENLWERFKTALE